MAELQEFIEIQGQRIKVRRRRRQRSLRINVYPDGRLVVSAGRSVDSRELVRFVLDRWTWVEKTQQHFAQNHVAVPQLKFTDGEVLLLLGEEYVLNVKFSLNRKVLVAVVGQQIQVLTPATWTDESYIRVRVRQALIKFYKTNGDLYLRTRFEVWRKQMDLRVTKLAIRGQKSRWGSCSRAGAINLNWKLLFAPPDVVDYVVIHELSHIVHFNHSKAFWKMVEQYCPNYKLQRQWLKENELRMSQF